MRVLRWCWGAIACCVIACPLAGIAGAAIPPPGDPAASSAIILHQGSETVSLADIDAYLEHNVPEADRAGFLRSGERILAMIRNILLTRQLANEARTLGIDRDPMIAPQLGKGDDDSVLAKARLDRFADTLDVPDFSDLAHERYLLSPSKFVERGTVDIRQIVVSTNGRGEDGARKLADELHAKAVAAPDDFPELIAAYSDDPNKAETSGVMEDMADPKYTSQLRDAALALENVGDISPPIRTSIGFQILQLIRRTVDRQKPFEEVRDDMVERIRADWITKQKEMHLAELQNLPVTDVDEELLLSVQSRYGTLSEPPSSGQEGGALQGDASQG